MKLVHVTDPDVHPDIPSKLCRWSHAVTADGELRLRCNGRLVAWITDTGETHFNSECVKGGTYISFDLDPEALP